MKSILKIGGVLVVAVVLFSTMFVAGFLVSGKVFPQRSVAPSTVSASGVPDGAPAEFQKDMPVFWEAWRIINDNFYQVPIDQDKMAYGAVGGMVDSLGDEHTAFVD